MYDIIVRGGLIVDGTGAPPFRADLGIRGDRIAKIGDLHGERADLVIEADGLVVAPGFIDIHNHSDLPIFVRPTADNFVLQGVTTLVVGNCGCSAAPVTELNKDFLRDAWRPYSAEVAPRWESFGDYMRALDELPKSVNVACLVGHGTVRSAVMGLEDREPSEAELREMQGLVEEAMRSGALGLSSGLIYVPGVFARTEELIALAKVVARYGGLYATHMRDEGYRLLEALMEAVRIGLSAGVPVEVSHLKAAGPPNWGRVSRALALIEDFAERGLDVTADAYPYEAGATGLSAILPPWAREGGTEAMLSRLKDPSCLRRVREELERRGLLEERWLDWSCISISWSPSHRELEGLTLAEIAERLGVDPFEAAVRLLIDDEGETGALFFIMCQEDVDRVMCHPLVAVGSDSWIVRPGEGRPHPRAYGTFPRVIARYVRELHRLSLPEAIRKMTSLPARKLGLWDRGLIRPGLKADLVIFDPLRIRDRATYKDPHRPPDGVEYVLVNGRVVAERGRLTEERPGRLLRRG